MLKNSNQASLIALVLVSVLVWASFLGIVFFTNPKSTGVFGAVVLVTSFIIGLISLAFFLWQLIILKKK